MPIPDYQTVMLPLLQFFSDGKEYHISEASKAMADHFSLTPEERKQLIPSRKMPVIRNRTGWARTYLHKAKLLERVSRGIWRITDRGRAVLKENPSRIDVKFLERYPEFIEFRQIRRTSDGEGAGGTGGSEETPEEALDNAYNRLRGDLESEILDQVKSSSPEFFERLVVELLVSMGYGGSLQDAGRAVGRSGDEGIDGIIKEDRLGLDVIYIQAKKWESNVSRPEIQKFAGALQGQRARKGVFITTSSFSREAHEYARMIESKIVLIDGKELARLMVDHDVGVSRVGAYEIKKLDTDYFLEDDG